jgi:glycosyltransferase involved in cell wall biosynthesis
MPSGEFTMVADRIKILFIIDYFHETGGTEKHLAQLISGLPRDAFSCSVVAFDLGTNPLLDGLRARGVLITKVPVGREYVPNAVVQARRLFKLIRANKCDIVQTFHQKADTYGAVIAWLSGVKHLISSKRDTGQLRKPWHVFLNRYLKSLFSAFIVVAEAVRVAVIASDHLPPSRITTIYNGVDISRFTLPTVEQKKAARARFGFAADDFVVGMVARFRPEKNHDVFFAGLSQAAGSIPSLKVLAVGSGPLLARFRESTAQTNLDAHTVFAGDVSDVVPCLWAMDVGCLTSGSNEGFSNSVVEQMAVGLPMIVTDVGGNAEAVVDGESGRVIPPLDVTALSQALIDLHENPARASAMGRASRARVEERFSLERMCAEHIRLYRSLCAVQAAYRRGN